jgi:hypothetical protein
MANWYSTGLAGQQKFKEMEALRAITTKQTNIRRFRLKPTEKAKVIFLDNPSTWLYEHSIQVDGRWETFTCTSDTETCPLCQINNKRSPILVASVIDTRKTISQKTGKEYQFQKVLLVLKGKGIRAVMRQFLEGNKVDLMHYSMEIERDTDKQSVACGEFMSLGKKVTVPALEAIAKKIEADSKEFMKPIDYFTVLAPKSDKELRTIAGIGDPMGADESTDFEDEFGLGLEEKPPVSETTEDFFEETDETEDGEEVPSDEAVGPKKDDTLDDLI